MSNSITESVNSAYGLSIKHIAIGLTVIVGAIIFGRGKKDTIIVSFK